MPQVKIAPFSDVENTQRLPIEVLKEAAEKLESATSGYVLGSVFLLHPADSDLFRYTFYLRVPDLNDYTDPLFYLWHHDKSGYDVWLLPAGAKQGTEEERKCSNEAALVQEIDNLFQADSARVRISDLMRMAKAQRAIRLEQ